MTTSEKKQYFIFLVMAVVVSGVIGGLTGFLAADSLARSQSFLHRLENVVSGKFDSMKPALLEKSQETPTVAVVEKVSPAVVSIIVSKDLPKLNNQAVYPDFFRQFMGDDFDRFFNNQTPRAGNGETEKKEIGSGSGFIVSQDGLVITNRHVVADDSAEYTVVTNKGDHYTAKVLARDPVNDLAVLKIDGNNFTTLNLGTSANLKPGQDVIAIGNALGEFSNTVSTGVISGLSRSIDAYSGGGGGERLIGLIQTDASINPGNSGGPLLDTNGNVIGINVAVAQGAQGIGFAIPIDQVKPTIDSVQKNGRLVRPWLGVRYIIINGESAKENKLDKDYGALVIKGDKTNEPAIISGSPADKAGLKEDDIILEVNEQKITEDNPLALIISRAKPGDKLTLKVFRAKKEITISVILEEMKS